VQILNLESLPEIRSVFPLDDDTLLAAAIVLVGASFRPNNFLGSRLRPHLYCRFRNGMPTS